MWHLEQEPGLLSVEPGHIQRVDMEVTAKFEQSGSEQAWLPNVLRFEDLLQMEVSVNEQAARFMGSVAVGGVLEQTAANDTQDSLWSAVQAARTGDQEADAMVVANAKSDVIERSIKAGMVTEVTMEINDNHIAQHGQSYRAILANSLKYLADNPVIRRRTEAEVRNGFRMEKLLQEGWLDRGYAMVVFSRAENLPEYGFFTDTMSCAIQVTTKEDDHLKTESAFVAGADSEFVFDHQVVSGLYASLADEDVSALDPAAIIDKPLLVHKSLLQNGVIDLVKMYDTIAHDTFFGLRQPSQDYLAYRDACRRREEELSGLVRSIADELIDHASDMHSPVDASRYLNKISEKHLLRLATIDWRIDPKVFGPQAAQFINQARAALDKRNYGLFNQSINQAGRYALSSACPGGLNMLSRLSGEVLGEVDADEYGSLEFLCPNGCLNRRQHGQLLEVCQLCGASVRCDNSSTAAKPTSRIIKTWTKTDQPESLLGKKNRFPLPV